MYTDEEHTLYLRPHESLGVLRHKDRTVVYNTSATRFFLLTVTIPYRSLLSLSSQKHTFCISMLLVVSVDIHICTHAHRCLFHKGIQRLLFLSEPTWLLIWRCKTTTTFIKAWASPLPLIAI